jgi:hypothetical protein
MISREVILFFRGELPGIERWRGSGNRDRFPVSESIENRGFSKNFVRAKFCSLPGGPTTSGFPVPEDGVVSSDRETHLALTAAGGTDRDRYVSSRRGSVMLPEQKNLPVNKIAPPSFVARF